MGSKRRRLALSCVACRRRKVKCDRSYPICVRCQKGGVSCDYVSYTKQDNVIPTPSDESPHLRREPSVESWTEDANVWHSRAKEHENARTQGDTLNATTPQARTHTKPLRDLHDRISDLETYMRAAGSRPIPSELFVSLAQPVGVGASVSRNVSQETERALLRGKAFKTQYFGPTHGASLLLQFEELSRFVKDILQRLPVLTKHRNAFKTQRKALNAPLMLPSVDTLTTLLPEQARTDSLVQEYFETFETTYRVLHAPTFFQKYKAFWNASYKGDAAAFLVQLLLVCASVNCSVPGAVPGFIGRSSVGRDEAAKWIEICQIWLDQQSQKHTTLEDFQVRVLLLIAKKLNCVKVKREWTESGHLLRMAMSAGLHREPTILSNKISAFDQEMRRRMWFTVLELDLQNSLDRGMGASIGPFDWDTLPPLNLHDEDFDENTEKLPPARPITDFTRTSFLCFAQQHLPLRLEILSRINRIRGGIDGDTAVELDQKIRQILDTFPRWTDTAAKVMATGLSELLLRQSLLLIHQSFTTHADAQATQFYAKAARRSAALSTMKIFTNFRPATGKTLCNFRDDLYRACIALCHDLVTSVNDQDDLLQDPIMAMRLTEGSVNLMEERVQSLGQGFHSYWLACSALGLMRSKVSTDEPPEKTSQDTAHRVAKLHDYMMSSQVAPPGSGLGLEDATMSTANTLVGMSGHPTPALPELDPFVTTTADPFNAFSETLFDFDFTDLWSMGGVVGSTHY